MIHESDALFVDPFYKAVDLRLGPGAAHRNGHLVLPLLDEVRVELLVAPEKEEREPVLGH